MTYAVIVSSQCDKVRCQNVMSNILSMTRLSTLDIKYNKLRKECVANCVEFVAHSKIEKCIMLC